jgi:hypothetical protein
VLVGIDISVEAAEEGELFFDMINGQFVGVGKNESGKALNLQGLVEVDHFIHGTENIGEHEGKLLE